MITTFFLPEKVDRQKQCHTLRDRHGQPDPVDADQQRKQQDIDDDQHKGSDKGNDRGCFSVGECGKHGGCKNIDPRKNVVY